MSEEKTCYICKNLQKNLKPGKSVNSINTKPPCAHLQQIRDPLTSHLNHCLRATEDKLFIDLAESVEIKKE
jgi:hypothetical protein